MTVSGPPEREGDMSKPRYRWWGYIKSIIRNYPALEGRYCQGTSLKAVSYTHLVTSGAGAVNRVIDIECKASSVVIRDGMRISGIVKRNYGFAGRRFVDELYKYGIIPQVEERYKDLFKLLSDRDTTEKQAMAAAAIICADELALSLIHISLTWLDSQKS